MKEFVGCILCGVPKKMSEFSDCWREADKLHIKLVDLCKTKKHMWWFMKTADSNEFFGLELPDDSN